MAPLPGPRPILLAALVLTLTVLPPASADPDSFHHIDVDLQAERFEAHLQGATFEGGNASDLRRFIDEEHGDANGEVSETEAAAYEEAVKDDLNDQLSNPLARGLTSNIKVNDRAPLKVEVLEIRLSDNVTGLVGNEQTVVRDVWAEIVFSSTSRPAANVTFAQDFRQAFFTMDWGYATFTGLAPWAIDGDSIEPGGEENPFWTGQGFNVTYGDMGDFSSGFEPLRFRLVNTTATADEGGKDTKKDTPAAAPVVLLGLVSVLALTLRRRRAT